MTHIFVSYSHADVPFARTLADELAFAGYVVWWDQKLRPGECYRRIIMSRLRAAEAVVVLWTASSIRSTWVVDEADEALRLGRLIPLTLELAPVDLPPGHKQLHSICWADRAQIHGALNSMNVTPIAPSAGGVAEQAPPVSNGAIGSFPELTTTTPRIAMGHQSEELFVLAEADMANHHFSSASDLFEQAYRHAPDNFATFRAALLHRWGAALYRCGQYQNAAGLLSRALEARRAIAATGPDVETARILDLFGQVLSRLDCRQEAEEALLEAQRIVRLALEPDDVEIARISTSLMRHYDETSDFARAGDAARRAISIFERKASETLVDNLEFLGHYASYLEETGDMTRARGLFDRIFKALEEREVPALMKAEFLNYYGKLVAAQGDYRAAIRALEDALQIRGDNLGARHYLVGETSNNLGIAKMGLGRLAEAELHFLAAGNLFATTPDDVWASTLAYSNLGTLRLRQGRPIRALWIAFRTAARLSKLKTRQTHRHVGSILADMAAALQALGQPALAQIQLERARQIYAANFAQQHPAQIDFLVLEALGKLGGDPRAAEPILTRALARYAEVYPDGHPNEIVPATALARIELDSGRAAAAITRMERCDGIAVRFLGPDHAYRAEPSLLLAEAYLASGDARAARTAAKVAKAILAAPHELDGRHAQALILRADKLAEAPDRTAT